MNARNFFAELKRRNVSERGKSGIRSQTFDIRVPADVIPRNAKAEGKLIAHRGLEPTPLNSYMVGLSLLRNRGLAANGRF